VRDHNEDNDDARSRSSSDYDFDTVVAPLILECIDETDEPQESKSEVGYIL
jgi:hypothetical protein